MHPHDHTPIVAAEEAPGYYEIMETAVRELLVAKQIISAGEIRRHLEVLDSRTPQLGARLVAKAWVDPEFKKRLLADGRSACEEMGISFYENTELTVLENTEEVHNLIVCTLCSCYPREVLGLPPDWYKLTPYRSRAVKEPRVVLAEFGTVIPDDVEIRVRRHDRSRTSGVSEREGAMNHSEELLKRLPNDIGGQPGAPIQRSEHQYLPWEKRCHALADILDMRKIVSTEEKRRGVESLGAEMIGKLTYYERWIAAFANILFQKGILTPGELAVKMEEVAARHSQGTAA